MPRRAQKTTITLSKQSYRHMTLSLTNKFKGRSIAFISRSNCRTYWLPAMRAMPPLRILSLGKRLSKCNGKWIWERRLLGHHSSRSSWLKKTSILTGLTLKLLKLIGLALSWAGTKLRTPAEWQPSFPTLLKFPSHQALRTPSSQSMLDLKRTPPMTWGFIRLNWIQVKGEAWWETSLL